MYLSRIFLYHAQGLELNPNNTPKHTHTHIHTHTINIINRETGMVMHIYNVSNSGSKRVQNHPQLHRSLRTA